MPHRDARKLRVLAVHTTILRKVVEQVHGRHLLTDCPIVQMSLKSLLQTVSFVDPDAVPEQGVDEDAQQQQVQHMHASCLSRRNLLQLRVLA